MAIYSKGEKGIWRRQVLTERRRGDTYDRKRETRWETDRKGRTLTPTDMEGRLNDRREGGRGRADSRKIYDVNV